MPPVFWLPLQPQRLQQLTTPKWFKRFIRTQIALPTTSRALISTLLLQLLLHPVPILLLVPDAMLNLPQILMTWASIF
jgi:hypothetical protein